MALDTTIGGVNADSYVSIADADAYHANRGLADASWKTLAPGIKEGALRKATQYLDATYKFCGIKITRTQALRWPRYNVWIDGYMVNYNELPKYLIAACCELALRATVQDLDPDLEPLLVTKETVGPISVDYSPIQRYSGRKFFDYVESLLAPILLGGGRGNVPVVRS